VWWLWVKLRGVRKQANRIIALCLLGPIYFTHRTIIPHPKNKTNTFFITTVDLGVSWVCYNFNMKIKIEDIKEAKYNPRKITDRELAGLKKSLEKFGQVVNFIVNKDMTLISGHQRLKAMRELGFTEVEAKVIDVDKKTEKKLNVLMNSGSITGEFDYEKLADLKQFVEGEDFVELNLEDLFSAADFFEDDNSKPKKDENGWHTLKLILNDDDLQIFNEAVTKILEEEDFGEDESRNNSLNANCIYTILKNREAKNGN
jgi:hypothetical protein